MATAERAKFVTAIGEEMKKRLPLLTEVWTAQVGAPRGFANYVIQWNTAEDGGAACCSPSPVLRSISLTERSCEATTPSRPNTDRQVCVFRMLKTPACTVPKSRVVSLLPTFAGRDLTL
jgi:hypothetical protein